MTDTFPQPSPDLNLPLTLWQKPWVQRVLPLATSLALHAAMVVLALVAYTTVQRGADAKPLETQLTINDSELIQYGVKRVDDVRPASEASRLPAQEEFPEGGTDWASKPIDRASLAGLPGGGDESADPLIGLSAVGGGFRNGPSAGPGAGEGRGPLAPFGTRSGGGDAGFMEQPGGSARSVVFVCDASGSMINTFASLKSELAKTVSRLKGVQGFNIIFFQAEKSAALDDKLLFATLDNKRKALKWLDTITTSGATDPLPALEQSFAIKPQLVYLLTDGDFPDNNAVRDAISRLNKDKQTKVNTILFTADHGTDDDVSKQFVSLLKSIAKDNGGVFSRVKAADLK